MHTYTQPGTYGVSLTVVSPEGCTSQLVVNDAVTVYGFPEADFYPSSTKSISIILSLILLTTTRMQLPGTGILGMDRRTVWSVSDACVLTVECILSSGMHERKVVVKGYNLPSDSRGRNCDDLCTECIYSKWKRRE
ncbi:MAG: hypothetical protein U0073_14960 [Bacteroidia bacterium]